MSAPRASAPLKYLGPQWFAPAMGWAGLAFAWHRAGAALGEAALGIAAACAIIAAAAFAIVSVLSVLRMARMPKALAEDLAHPARHAFLGAVPVTVLLLAADAALLLGPQPWIAAAWFVGVALQAAAAAWNVARWLSGRTQWPAITPVAYVPVVGNLVVPLAGGALGHHGLSWAFMGIGLLFWPVLTALLLARQLHQPLPERLQASWFVAIAPPAVAGSAALSLGAPWPAAAAALGVATLFAAAAASRVPAIARAPFAMPAWAVSFPLAALSALALRVAGDAAAMTMPAVVLLAIASVVIVGLSLATWKGLRAGTLLAPEPVATIAVSGDAP